MKPGRLYICPTPIGNLEDITLRTLNALRLADIIIAEDTREIRKLLDKYLIKKQVISYYKEKEREKLKTIIGLIEEGKNLALVSDRGTPGLSDPGSILIRSCIEEKIEVVALPGPTSIITALIGSGLPTEKFIFIGFLPKKKKQKQEVLSNLLREEGTIILFESPFRLLSTLGVLKEIYGEREIVVARELTKKHEEFIRGKIDEVFSRLSKKKIKGEIIVLIKGLEEERI
ncbi:MAG: 16S rRNA (cytidine(1402)-2'-O)-methyltransferase, partial [Actinomycetia bacterium]|nr:16S rRNA (cytidine(1402)-2'-O)-methyltransferase [Actinomycetes bacterium]